MKHKKVKNLLAAFVLDELEADERAEVRAHLEQCEECRREAEEMRSAFSLLKEAAGVLPVVELTPDRRAGIFDHHHARSDEDEPVPRSSGPETGPDRAEVPIEETEQTGRPEPPVISWQLWGGIAATLIVVATVAWLQFAHTQLRLVDSLGAAPRSRAPVSAETGGPVEAITAPVHSVGQPVDLAVAGESVAAADASAVSDSGGISFFSRPGSVKEGKPAVGTTQLTTDSGKSVSVGSRGKAELDEIALADEESDGMVVTVQDEAGATNFSEPPALTDSLSSDKVTGANGEEYGGDEMALTAPDQYGEFEYFRKSNDAEKSAELLDSSAFRGVEKKKRVAGGYFDSRQRGRESSERLMSGAAGPRPTPESDMGDAGRISARPWNKPKATKPQSSSKSGNVLFGDGHVKGFAGQDFGTVPEGVVSEEAADISAGQSVDHFAKRPAAKRAPRPEPAPAKSAQSGLAGVPVTSPPEPEDEPALPTSAKHLAGTELNLSGRLQKPGKPKPSAYLGDTQSPVPGRVLRKVAQKDRVGQSIALNASGALAVDEEKEDEAIDVDYDGFTDFAEMRPAAEAKPERELRRRRPTTARSAKTAQLGRARAKSDPDMDEEAQKQARGSDFVPEGGFTLEAWVDRSREKELESVNGRQVRGGAGDRPAAKEAGEEHFYGEVKNIEEQEKKQDSERSFSFVSGREYATPPQPEAAGPGSTRALGKKRRTDSAVAGVALGEERGELGERGAESRESEEEERPADYKGREGVEDLAFGLGLDRNVNGLAGAGAAGRRNWAYDSNGSERAQVTHETRPDTGRGDGTDQYRRAADAYRAGDYVKAKQELNQLLVEQAGAPRAKRAEKLATLVREKIYTEELEKAARRDGDGEGLPQVPVRPPQPVNPFVMTEKDRLSTFSLEADTASYTMTRRYVRHGYRPPPGIVRMEEFINAFDYNYPREARQTFTIHPQAAPAPFGKGLTALKIGVKGRVLGRDGRKPAHLVYVIDASGSMARSDRMPLVKYALSLLLDQLDAKDQITIVAYGTRPRLLLEAVSAEKKAEILDAVRRIECGASTNMLAGIELGYQLAVRNFRADHINRIVLCSDGVANVGPSDAEALLDKVARYRGQGVAFTSVGVGAGSYDDRMLEQLANKGDGNYVYIDTPEQAHRVFVEEMSATLQTIAKDVKIQVEFNPRRVRRYRLIGYENRAVADADFRNDTVDAGEIGSGQSATALYELELIESPGETEPDIGTVYVRCRNLDTGEIEEISTRLKNTLAQDRTPAEDPYFFLAACVAEFAEILRGSTYAEGSDLGKLEAIMIRTANALPLDERVQELLALVQHAQGLPRAR